MRIQAAVLCDAANVRESLLNVLSAGVTRVLRQSLPAGATLTVALIVELAPGELSRPHEVSVRLVGPSGKKLAELMAGFQSRPQSLEQGEHGLIAIPMPIPFEITEYGAHHVRIAIDKTAATDHLRFWVREPPNPISTASSPN